MCVFVCVSACSKHIWWSFRVKCRWKSSIDDNPCFWPSTAWLNSIPILKSSLQIPFSLPSSLYFHVYFIHRPVPLLFLSPLFQWLIDLSQSWPINFRRNCLRASVRLLVSLLKNSCLSYWLPPLKVYLSLTKLFLFSFSLIPSIPKAHFSRLCRLCKTTNGDYVFVYPFTLLRILKILICCLIYFFCRCICFLPVSYHFLFVFVHVLE